MTILWPSKTMLDQLVEAGIEVLGVGKIMISLR